jgi:hypothetical protein
MAVSLFSLTAQKAFLVKIFFKHPMNTAENSVVRSASINERGLQKSVFLFNFLTYSLENILVNIFLEHPLLCFMRQANKHIF